MDESRQKAIAIAACCAIWAGASTAFAYAMVSLTHVDVLVDAEATLDGKPIAIDDPALADLPRSPCIALNASQYGSLTGRVVLDECEVVGNDPMANKFSPFTPGAWRAP